ncbi:MAG: hypothetical protein HRT72_12560 [Flavobacteriales bacterium]|nr:hypothetical protein [Flavobacteriales bacterium]
MSENQEPEEEQKGSVQPEIQREEISSKKGLDKFKIISIILFLIILGLLFKMNSQRDAIVVEIQKQEKIDYERKMLEEELSALLAEYEDMTTSNDSLNAQLVAEKTKIEEMLVELKQGKDDKALTAKYKKEAETLRGIMKGYIVAIDSLNTMNQNLTAQNTWVRKVLVEERVVNETLVEEKGQLQQKVQLMSLLKAFNANVTPIKFRFGNVESKTSRARRVDKIEICFTLAENEIADKGKRDVYVRISTPSGKVLAKGSSEEYMFNFPGGRGYFSIKEDLDYQGEEVEKCIYWYRQQEEMVESGEYVVSLFSDGGEIGKMSFNLE